MLALKSGHGDLANYHERSGHENSVWCPCRKVPFTRAHIFTCVLQDKKWENTRPMDRLTDKRIRKLKLRTEDAINFITWKRPRMVTYWARSVNLLNVLQKR